MKSQHLIIVGVVLALALLLYGSLQPVIPVGAARLASGNAAFTIYLPFVAQQYVPASRVTLQNIAYNPKSITVSVGKTVIWTNMESGGFIQHTVTSGIPGVPSGVFDSPVLSTGESFQFTFSAPGTFDYYCRIHGAAMTGTVIVTP